MYIGGGSSLSREELDEVRAEVDADFEAERRGSKKSNKKRGQKQSLSADDDLGSLFGGGISGKLPRFANKITWKVMCLLVLLIWWLISIKCLKSSKLIGWTRQLWSSPTLIYVWCYLLPDLIVGCYTCCIGTSLLTCPYWISFLGVIRLYSFLEVLWIHSLVLWIGLMYCCVLLISNFSTTFIVISYYFYFDIIGFSLRILMFLGQVQQFR